METCPLTISGSFFKRGTYMVILFHERDFWMPEMGQFHEEQVRIHFSGHCEGSDSEFSRLYKKKCTNRRFRLAEAGADCTVGRAIEMKMGFWIGF